MVVGSHPREGPVALGVDECLTFVFWVQMNRSQGVYKFSETWLFVLPLGKKKKRPAMGFRKWWPTCPRCGSP